MPNWGQVLVEINEIKIQQDKLIEKAEQKKRSAVDAIRRKYLNALFKYTGRNVIAYYSGWLSKPGIDNQDIVDEDKNGFMMAVHQLDKTQGLDLIIHTPGGHIAATQSIVDYLHKIFGNNISRHCPDDLQACGDHTPVPPSRERYFFRSQPMI